MYAYNPTQDADSPRLLLIQGVGHPGTRFDDTDFGHVEARIVRMAASGYDGREVSGYRWAEWTSTKKSAYFVDDLVFTCQFSKQEVRDGTVRLYGFKPVFREVYAVEAREAVQMARTLTRLQKVVEHAPGHVDAGGAIEFAAFVIDCGKALGIHDILFYQNDKARGDLHNRDLFYVSPHLRDMYRRIDAIVHEIAGVREKAPTN